MVKFENTEVVGWEAAIRGMRNPKNSWDRSDSDFNCTKGHCDGCYYEKKLIYKEESDIYAPGYYCNFSKILIGPNDLKLMQSLCKAGSVHRKFMRMINVYVDITAPLYWWKEFDTYKVGTVANSCSTMHKIAEKEFTLDDFSHEHLIDDIHDTHDTHSYASNISVCYDYTGVLENIIEVLNNARERYLETKDKKYWWQMIQLLPSSYNQKRTVILNYEVLAGIYQPDCRRNHKLDEWCLHGDLGDGKTFRVWDYGPGFCDWIKTLPYHELITKYSQRDFKE